MQILNPQQQNFKIEGDKLLVKLEAYQTTTSESGIIVPKYENYTTDGGKPASSIAHEKYSSIATVIQISPKAQDLLDANKSTIKVGDTIVLYPSTLNSSNWFILDRTRPVTDYEGYLLIHPNHIQASL
jgi:co-chaperonin GroES (HSP10)